MMTSKPLFPVTSHRLGVTQRSMSLRSDGFSQPHTRNPGRTLVAPPQHIWGSASGPRWRPHSMSGALHQWRGEEPPLFLPQDSSDHAYLLSLLPALHMGSPSILLCRSYSLHLPIASEKSCQSWQVGRARWRQTDRSWKGLNIQ